MPLTNDPFATGGVMDAPDLQTRIARNRRASGLPLTADQERRLAVREGLESGDLARQTPGISSLLRPGAAPVPGSASGLNPGRGPIDVNSYVGSRYAPGNENPAPAPGYAAPTYNREASADALLRGRFGAPPNERTTTVMPSNQAVAGAYSRGEVMPQPAQGAPGQIDITTAIGTRSIPAPGISSLLRPGGFSSNGAEGSLPADSAQPVGISSLLKDSQPPSPTSADPRSVSYANPSHVLSPTERHANLEDRSSFVDEQVRGASAMSHLATLTAAADRMRRESLALKAAHAAIVAGESGDAAYLGRGGTEAAMLSALRRERVDPQFAPNLVDLGNNVTAMTTSRSSAVPVQKGPTKDTGVQQVKVGPRTLFYHADSKRYFDEEGKPIAFPTGGSNIDEEIAALSRTGGGSAPLSAAKPTPANAKDPFTPGKIYTDKTGNRAKYAGNGKWDAL